MGGSEGYTWSFPQPAFGDPLEEAWLPSLVCSQIKAHLGSPLDNGTWAASVLDHQSLRVSCLSFLLC